jgi:hypothetical protein
MQKYINENKPTNTNFELYEKVYYKNEEYIINKINKGTIEVINLFQRLCHCRRRPSSC